MSYYYEYIIEDLFTGEEIKADGKRFSINSAEEAFLLLEVLNTGYMQQGGTPKAVLKIKPILLSGVN